MLRFRNLDLDPSLPVTTWGVEGILTALERGNVADWGRLLNALDHDGDPGFREDLRQALDCADPDLPILQLFHLYFLNS